MGESGVQEAVKAALNLERVYDALTTNTCLVVWVLVVLMVVPSAWWLARSKFAKHGLIKVAKTLGTLVRDLDAEHPIRQRLAHGPLTAVSFEDIAILADNGDVDGAESGLLEEADHLSRAERRKIWVGLFAQLSVYLGLLGTVMSLVGVDLDQADSFRKAVPLALGTTLVGLLGAITLSLIASSFESTLLGARQSATREMLRGIPGSGPDGPKPLRLESQS